MAKIIITEGQLTRLRKAMVNEDNEGYGDLKPGGWRNCQGVGDMKKCLTTSGNLKFDINGEAFPYHTVIYKVIRGDNMSRILQKLNQQGNYDIAHPMEFNTLLKSENEVQPDDVLLFDFGA